MFALDAVIEAIYFVVNVFTCLASQLPGNVSIAGKRVLKIVPAINVLMATLLTD
jgi:hypothetical protein